MNNGNDIWPGHDPNFSPQKSRVSLRRKNSILIQLCRALGTVVTSRQVSAGGIAIPLLALTCVLSLVACQSLVGVTAKPTVIRIAGAMAMQPTLYDLTAAFSQRHPNVIFEVTGGGSTVGEERVLAGQVDLAASTLVSSTVPTVLLQPRRVSAFTRTPIGLDGLAVIVHQDNPIENLTLEQLQALYSGRVLGWEDVGGGSSEVLLTTRETSSGSQQLFLAQVMGEERFSLTALVLPTDADVVDFVGANVNAIGYVARAYVVAALAQDDSSQRNQATQSTNDDGAPTVHMVALEGQLPTLQSIQDQSYALIQPLYLVSRTRPRGWLQQFVDFTLSPAGQAIVARYYARIR